MILPTDILEEIKKLSVELNYGTYEKDYGYGGYHITTKSLGRGIREGKFSELANNIYTKVAETFIEDAELRAEVKAYEAIIENSNFKVAVETRKNETTK